MSNTFIQLTERFPEPQTILVKDTPVREDLADEARRRDVLYPLITQTFDYLYEEKMIRIGKFIQGNEGFMSVTGYEGVRLSPEMLSAMNVGETSKRNAPTRMEALNRAISTASAFCGFLRNQERRVKRVSQMTNRLSRKDVQV